MSDSQPTPAGPGESDRTDSAGPAGTDRARTDPAHTDDPEILELLAFEPVPRRFKRQDGWTAALQRKFIVLLAKTGSPNAAAEALGKNRYGVEKLYKAAGAASFRAAWDAAIELFEERAAERLHAEHMQSAGSRPPFADRRRKAGAWAAAPVQMLNEFGEWEDEDSLRQRALEAKDSISAKLLRCRRLYLREISGNPGKRAAFEMLTELPIDWDKAERLEAQADEPWNRANQRQPDMVLTAESGWMMGEHGYGEDKKAALRAEIDKYREEEGLEPIDWEDESAECKDTAAQQHVDLHESRETQSTEGQPSSADGSPGRDPGEPDRRHVGFTPRDEPSLSSPQDKPGPRIRRV